MKPLIPSTRAALGYALAGMLALGLIAGCNLGERQQQAVAAEQASRLSAMFAGLPTPHDQSLAAKKTGFYLFREARAHLYGRPVPGLPNSGPYHEFTRHIPPSFYGELQAVARQALRRQPGLAEVRISPGDAYQLVDLDAVNAKAQRMVVLFTVEQIREDPYGYDWALRVAVDVDRWRVLGWEVNSNEPSQGYPSARSQFMGVGGQPRYVRAVLEPGRRLSAIGPGRLGKVYFAELGPQESDTRVYDLDAGKIYRVNQGPAGATLDLIGTYQDWVPTPPWLRGH